MIKLDKFSLLVHISNRFILINVTPTTIEILDKNGFLNGSSRMPTQMLHFLALISSDKLLFTNFSQDISCDSLSFCALCFTLKKQNYSFAEILNCLESNPDVNKLLS